MSLREQFDTASAIRDGNFPSTRWSVVCQARSTDPASRTALAELCRMYWRPVYSYLRGQGNAAHDAEDLTQGFFVMLLDHNLLASVDEAKGRLRSFLLVALKRFAANEYKRGRTQKRGGGSVHVSVDAVDAEECCTGEMAAGLAPDLLFERRWALTLLERVIAAVQTKWQQIGRGAEFYVLKASLLGEGPAGGYAAAARQLGSTEGAVKVAVHRLRKAFRAELRAAISETVSDPAEIDEELKYLEKALGA
jgi:RNA polymerase sigma-70 factor (ECF subfamily)